MDPTHLMTMACTITPMNVSGVDEYNDDVLGAGAPVSATCYLNQTSRDEQTAGDNTQQQTFAVYLPPTITIDANDRITVGADTFEVIGPPWKAYNPRDRRVTHIELTARKVA